jgi:hypothetical protein
MLREGVMGMLAAAYDKGNEYKDAGSSDSPSSVTTRSL